MPTFTKTSPYFSYRSYNVDYADVFLEDCFGAPCRLWVGVGVQRRVSIGKPSLGGGVQTASATRLWRVRCSQRQDAPQPSTIDHRHCTLSALSVTGFTFLGVIASAARAISPIPKHIFVTYSVCLSQSCLLLEPFDVFKCHGGTLEVQLHTILDVVFGHQEKWRFGSGVVLPFLGWYPIIVPRVLGQVTVVENTDDVNK